MSELITVNVLEVASEMADIALQCTAGNLTDRILDEKFPNGIEVEKDGISTYTEEAQDFFNERYAYYESWLRSIAEPTNNVGAQEQPLENEEIDLCEHPELWSKELNECQK